MFNHEYSEEFFKGVAKGAGVIAAGLAYGLIYKTNIAGSLFFGICCCDYCKKTPQQLEEKLKKKRDKENKLIAEENIPFYKKVPNNIQQRRENAQKEIEKDEEYLEKYRKQYPVIQNRIRVRSPFQSSE